jgi:hypothetical protein
MHLTATTCTCWRTSATQGSMRNMLTALPTWQQKINQNWSPDTAYVQQLTCDSHHQTHWSPTYWNTDMASQQSNMMNGNMMTNNGGDMMNTDVLTNTMMNTIMLNSNIMTNNSGYLNNEGYSCYENYSP